MECKTKKAPDEQPRTVQETKEALAQRAARVMQLLDECLRDDRLPVEARESRERALERRLHELGYCRAEMYVTDTGRAVIALNTHCDVERMIDALEQKS